MIKCLECGFETDRLQWTHFKYKCTGRFSDSKEYRVEYPDAILVDSSLAKKTAITKDKLVEKYGKEDGIIRWDSYRSKQSHSNSFEYKRDMHGWSREEFDQFNSSRSSTLEKMIIRHGEEEGALKWIAYCERQAYTNTKAYFIEQYGIKKGTAKYLDINKRKASSNPILVSERLGITVDEAIEVILSRQNSSEFWGSNIEKEFTAMLINAVGELEYTTFTRPYGKWAHLLNSYVIYDIKHKDFVIEFNGDYWHANPRIYKEDAIIRGKTAKQIQHRDSLKCQTAIDLGFRVLTVWECDFRANKQDTIRKVTEWIQSGQQ